MDGIENKNNRIISLDLLRIIACLGVISIHTKPIWVRFVSPWSVSLFVLISGSLLLNKDETFAQFLHKRVIRIPVVFAVWSVLYTVINLCEKKADGIMITYKDTFIDLVSGKYHMWFLFMIWGLYLLLPAYRLINRSEYLKYIVLVLILFSVVIPSVQELEWFHWSEYETGIINLGVFYYPLCFLTGSLLPKNKLSRKYEIGILACGIVGLIMILLGIGTLLRDYMCVIAVFYWLYHYVQITNTKLRKAVYTISECTFGMYLMHDMFITFFKRVFNVQSAELKFFFVVICAFVTTYIIRKIPKIGKYIT